jgi:hypothetical protein
MIFSLAPKRLTMLSSIASLSLALMASSVRADRPPIPDSKRISKAAAESCGVKLKRLEDFAASSSRSKKQTTEFSENEINSYLALELSKNYHPSLKSLLIVVEESKLQGVASIDFDSLAMNSKTVLTKLMTKMFSGVHTLSVRGKLVTAEGKARFQLEEAYFDDSALPNFLVEEIISAVGRKQKPPFDPMQPSKLPYGIQTVELHPGRALVHQ